MRERRKDHRRRAAHVVRTSDRRQKDEDIVDVVADIAIGVAVASLFNSDSDSCATPSVDTPEGGGGEFGGGGASGSWDD